MLHFQTRITIPFNCPFCRQSIFYCEDLQTGSRAPIVADFNRLKIHECYEKRGEDYWQPNVFRLLKEIRFDTPKPFERLKRRPEKFRSNHRYFGVTFRRSQDSDGENSLYEMIGTDGHPFSILYTGEHQLPPFVLVNLGKITKTAKGILRVSKLDVPVFPEFPRYYFNYNEIYELRFEADDPYRLELFTDKVLSTVKRSGGKILNCFPKTNRKTSDEKNIFRLQINLASGDSMDSVFRQISIPGYAKLEIRQRKIKTAL